MYTSPSVGANRSFSRSVFNEWMEEVLLGVLTHPHGVVTANPAPRGLTVHPHCLGISACQEIGFGEFSLSNIWFRCPTTFFFSFRKYRVTKDFCFKSLICEAGMPPITLAIVALHLLALAIEASAQNQTVHSYWIGSDVVQSLGKVANSSCVLIYNSF